MSLKFDQLIIGEVTTSGKGPKSAQVFSGRDLGVWLPASSMTVAYEPGVYSGEEVSRVNLCLRPTEEVQSELSRLDDWVIAYVTANSERLLGKSQTEEQVKARYQTTLRCNDKGYPPVIRCKMNVYGKGQVNVWSNKESREQPSSWAGCQVKVRILLKHLYLMGANFGLTLDITDVDIENEQMQICPF